ncbi:MAG: hypothetical protein ACP5LB_02845 [Candidatus Bathyarchaeia archaeon]
MVDAFVYRWKVLWINEAIGWFGFMVGVIISIVLTIIATFSNF